MVAICVVFMPQGKVSMASGDALMMGYQAYPSPSLKPSQCTFNTEKKNENFDKKQAVVAALGLYLGVKSAVAPIDDVKTSLCV